MSDFERAFRLVNEIALDDRPDALKAMTTEAPTTERYNFYLYRLARALRPSLFVETGTDRGRSALHVACGSPVTRVVSIDIDEACGRELRFLAETMSLDDRVEARLGNSILTAASFEDRSIDLLFLDSLHTYEHLSQELVVYLPKVRPGGIVLLDDIHLDAGMQRCWAEITLLKHDISCLHFSGFGLVGVPGAMGVS